MAGQYPPQAMVRLLRPFEDKHRQLSLEDAVVVAVMSHKDLAFHNSHQSWHTSSQRRVCCRDSSSLELYRSTCCHQDVLAIDL